MPRFTKEADECENDFERWLYLIKNMRILKRMPFKAKRAVWDKLLEVADVASLSQKEHEAYQRALMNYWDYHNAMEAAQEDGHKAGLEAGWTEGHKAGLEEGLKEGELKKQIEIARKLKAMGLPVSAIQESTGLSESEIQQL